MSRFSLDSFEVFDVHDSRVAQMMAGPIARPLTRVEVLDVASSLELLLKLRDQCVYHGVGWLRLNSACRRLSDRFWREASEVGPAGERD